MTTETQTQMMDARGRAALNADMYAQARVRAAAQLFAETGNLQERRVVTTATVKVVTDAAPCALWRKGFRAPMQHADRHHQFHCAWRYVETEWWLVTRLATMGTRPRVTDALERVTLDTGTFAREQEQGAATRFVETDWLREGRSATMGTLWVVMAAVLCVSVNVDTLALARGRVVAPLLAETELLLMTNSAMTATF